MLAKKKDEETPRRVGAGHAPGGPDSVVASGMRVVGDCETDGRIRIEGRIAGGVRAPAVELTESGAVEGDLSAPDSEKGDQLHVIAGRVEGSVSAGRVELRERSVVLGGIVADEAVIDGEVRGGIVARRRLALGRSAVVEGEIRARRLSVEDGARVDGTIQVGQKAATDEKRAAAPTPVESRSRDEKVLAVAG